MIAHQRLHFGKFSCTYCYRNFSRRDDLQDHLPSYQKVISTHLQNFEHETSIILIPLGKHDNKNDVNDNNEVSNMNYEVPILVDENEETPNNLKTCLICDTQVIHLTKHMQVHNKDYSEQCYICDKTFTLKNIKFSNLLTIVRNVCSYDGVGINLDNLTELEIAFQMLISPLLVREKYLVKHLLF